MTSKKTVLELELELEKKQIKEIFKLLKGNKKSLQNIAFVQVVQIRAN